MKKINSYMGFARRSGNMVAGTDTCITYMKKNKIKLLIIAEDIAANSKEKILSTAKKTNTPYRIFGKSDEISHMSGYTGRTTFGITDDNFADIIAREIDKYEK